MAVSIDAQAAINRIAAELEARSASTERLEAVGRQMASKNIGTSLGLRGDVISNRASSSPDPVIGFSSPSTKFGDEEFIHEVAGYGMYDPVLRAGLRKFGAGIASYA